jgi:hypothetical protein
MLNPGGKGALALTVFRRKKIMVIDELAELLECSLPTVRRRLKQWQTYTSYNHNGRYYVLPEIPKFDENGLWKYKTVLFCKYGNLKQTVIHLVIKSPAGLTTKEAQELLQVSMASFMPCYRNLLQLRRENIGGQFVYFSSDEQTFIKQKKNRLEYIERVGLIKLPTDAEAVIILVERIKYPRLSLDQLAERLIRKGHLIKAGIIKNLFQQHGLLEGSRHHSVKKTLDIKQ